MHRIVISTKVLAHPKNHRFAVTREFGIEYWILPIDHQMETERVVVLAKPVDYGIHQVATEHTKLLTQSFDYGTRDFLTKNAKSKECIVQMPKQSAESLYR